MTITGRLHLRITRSDTETKKISPMLERPCDPITMMEGASFHGEVI
jgi:hypothetical protein